MVSAAFMTAAPALHRAHVRPAKTAVRAPCMSASPLRRAAARVAALPAMLAVTVRQHERARTHTGQR